MDDWHKNLRKYIFFVNFTVVSKFWEKTIFEIQTTLPYKTYHVVQKNIVKHNKLFICNVRILQQNQNY